MKKMIAATALCALCATSALANDAPAPKMTADQIEVVSTQNATTSLPPAFILGLLTMLMVAAAVSGGGGAVGQVRFR